MVALHVTAGIVSHASEYRPRSFFTSFFATAHASAAVSSDRLNVKDGGKASRVASRNFSISMAVDPRCGGNIEFTPLERPTLPRSHKYPRFRRRFSAS